MDSLGSGAIGAVNIVGQCRWYIYIYATFILCLQIWNHSGSIPATLVPVGSRLLSNGCSSLSVILNFQPITVPTTSQIPLAASGRFDWSTREAFTTTKFCIKHRFTKASLRRTINHITRKLLELRQRILSYEHAEHVVFWISPILTGLLFDLRFPNYPNWWYMFDIFVIFLLAVLFNMAVHSRSLSGPFSKRRAEGCSTMGWKSEYGRLRSQVSMIPGCLWYVYVYNLYTYIYIYYRCILCVVMTSE